MPLPESAGRYVLDVVAREISPLLTEVVFVGGHVAALLITDPAATRVRYTEDVDVIVQATTRAKYEAVSERLRQMGCRHAVEEGVICRWRTPRGYLLDVMPTDERILGFSNRWYPEAIRSAVEFPLTGATTIRIANPPVFLATKWVAFHDRGASDPFASHDLEDIITVVAGRPGIVAEVGSSPDPVRSWLVEQTRLFLMSADAEYAIQGALPDAAHLPGVVDDVIRRFHAIATL